MLYVKLGAWEPAFQNFSKTSRNWIDPSLYKHKMICPRNWNRFLSLYTVLYSQVLQYLLHIFKFSISSLFSAFQVLSSLCIFRVCFSFTFWNFPIFLDSGFFTYCFVYFQVFYIFDIFRSYYIFCILEFFVFSSLLCFSYLLYFKFPLPLPIGFLSQKYFIYLPICIKELTTVFPISVMLKDLWLLWWRIKS